MVKYVMTVKLGIKENEKGIMKTAAIVARNTETGAVTHFGFGGTEEDIKEWLDFFESNGVKIKFE